MCRFSMLGKISSFTAPTALALALGVFGSVAYGETAEEALKRLDGKSKNLTTAHFTQVITSNTQMVDSKSVSEVWTLRTLDGEMKMRTESDSEMTFKGMDLPPQKTKSIVVMDGTFLWSETEIQGTPMVTKMKTPAESQLGLSFMVDRVKDGNGKVLEPEQIDGKTCVVIEYALDEMGTGVPVTHRIWIAEENGMMLKSITKDQMSGDTEMLVKDVKTGVDISPELFTYKPAEGVQVMDMTGM